MDKESFSCGTDCTACGGDTQGCTDALIERAEKAETERDRLIAEVERLTAVLESGIIVPPTPEPARIESMCIRYDHGHGLKRMTFTGFGGDGVESDEEFERRKESTRVTMRQLYEEATGQGFFKPAA